MAEAWHPRPYMRTGIKFCVERACAALWFDPGLGKTSTILAVLKILLGQRLVRGCLAVVPLHPMYNSWPGEMEKWTDFNGISYTILHGPNKLKNLFGPKKDLYLINPDGLAWLFAQLVGEEWPFDMLVIDESTKFKHTKTKRFKLLDKHIGKFRRRYELTGSPAPNGLENVFGQIKLLDGGNALGRFITHFRNSYFNQTGYGGYTYVLKLGADKAIYGRLKGLVLRMDAKDWLDLPPLVLAGERLGAKEPEHTTAHWLDLPKELRAEYRRLDNQFLVDLEGGRVTAANAAVASMKCQQFANGAVYLDDDHSKDSRQREVQVIHDLKLDALEDLVEERQGKPLLVAYWFGHDLARLRKRFPEAGVMEGDPKKVKRLVDQWNAGGLSVAFLQPASMAWGLNLQEQKDAQLALFSLFWDLEAYDQLIKRILRQGFEGKRLVLHRFAVRDTTDEIIIDSYERKGTTQSRLMEAMKRYARRRAT